MNNYDGISNPISIFGDGFKSLIVYHRKFQLNIIIEFQKSLISL